MIQGPPPRQNYLWVVIAATVVIVISCVTIIVFAAKGDDDSAAADTSTSKSSLGSTTKASVPKSTTSKSTTPPPPPAPITPVDPAALPGLLLTGEQAGAAFGTVALNEIDSGSNPIGGDSPIPLECRSVWAPIHTETYADSGYTTIARRSVRGDADDSPGLIEAVVSFPDNRAAQAAMDRVVAAWRACPALDFSETFRGRSVAFKAGDVAVLDGVASLPLSAKSRIEAPETSIDPDCQRAITVRRNVVVDLLACSPSVGTSGTRMAAEIAARVDAAPPTNG